MPREPKNGERDTALLLDMLLAAQDAISFVAAMSEAEFNEARLQQNAVIRSLEVIGEAAGKVSDSFRSAHDAIPWREIIATRHRLIHGYADVRLDVVWRVVRDQLPTLVGALRPLVPKDAGS